MTSFLHNVRLCAGSREPSLLAHTNYGSRWRLISIFLKYQSICDNKYKLKNHVINQSCPCQARRVLLLLLKGPRHRIKGQDAQYEILKWASIATRDCLTLVHANNKGAGLSSCPRSLISAFIVRLLESIISELAYCKISFLFCLCSWTDCQSGLSLTQSEPRKTAFSRDGLKMYFTTYFNHKDPV